MDKNFSVEPTLNIIKAICILDCDGDRILTKYYDKNIFGTLKDQKEFEKKIYGKSSKTQFLREDIDVMSFDGLTIVYKQYVNLYFYIIGSSFENELMLESVVECLYSSLYQISNREPMRSFVYKEMKKVMLIIDEICDDGIINNSDYKSVLQRMDFKKDENIPVGDQAVEKVTGALNAIFW